VYNGLGEACEKQKALSL